jgi:hypothetical protein
MGLSFTIAPGLRHRSHSQVRVPRDSRPYFTVSDSRLPQSGGPGPRIYIPQEQDGPVIPPGTGFEGKALHIRSHIRLTLTMLPWKWNRPLLTSYWISKTIKSVQPEKLNLWKTKFSFSHYPPKDTTYAVSFREMVSINFRNIIYMIRKLFKKIVILLLDAGLKGPYCCS